MLVHKTRQLKVVSFAVVLGTSLLLLGCSDDKSPPDDGKGEKAHEIAKVACSPETAPFFRQCAQELLETSELTEAERMSLASCGFAIATPESSSEDLFEVARATVKAHCIFRY